MSLCSSGATAGPTEHLLRFAVLWCGSAELRGDREEGDKGAAAEPFGCAQAGQLNMLGRLRPAWAPVWGPGPLDSVALLLLPLCVRDRPLPSS
ncbi:hypothetical protein WMY93_018829 [Mugilogobius chulae]|uniref:Uncharacterized protein n=1 Tax=Mugilogobius chulae TaxID=88201 RepID=A0AAW0NJY9_9GOBI